MFNTYAFPSTMVLRAGNTIAFPFHLSVFMRIHMRAPKFLWKHIPNVKIFEHHVYRCGNTVLIHTGSQSRFLSSCGNTLVFTSSGSINLETPARFLVFLSKQQETHTRVCGYMRVSTLTFSHLLLEQQETPGLSPAASLSAPTRLQLQPCF